MPNGPTPVPGVGFVDEGSGSVWSDDVGGWVNRHGWVYTGKGPVLHSSRLQGPGKSAVMEAAKKAGALFPAGTKPLLDMPAKDVVAPMNAPAGLTQPTNADLSALSAPAAPGSKSFQSLLAKIRS